MEKCKTDILEKPAWIDWNCTGYPGNNIQQTGMSYRKITNLWGGNREGGNLEWLSEFKTKPGKANEIVNSPIYDKNPKYLWFYDGQNKKLKVSDNNSKTLEITTPIQDCKNKDCCSTSSSIEGKKCVYEWYSSGLGFFGNPMSCYDSRFKGPLKYTDNDWEYQNTDDYKQKNGELISGTFCNKIKKSTSPVTNDYVMKTYIGCDCQSTDRFHCSNIHESSNCFGKDVFVDDYHLNAYIKAPRKCNHEYRTDRILSFINLFLKEIPCDILNDMNVIIKTDAGYFEMHELNPKYIYIRSDIFFTLDIPISKYNIIFDYAINRHHHKHNRCLHLFLMDTILSQKYISNKIIDYASKSFGRKKYPIYVGTRFIAKTFQDIINLDNANSHIIFRTDT